MSAESFRRATNLELFLDLAFVFAVTQIAGLLAHDLTLAGFGRGLLVAWLTWWLWSQFAWAGTTVDLEKNVGAQLLVLATIPAALLMAVGLPDAYHHTGFVFGGGYLLVQAAALVIQGREMWPNPKRRSTFLRYSGLASIGPVLVAAGGCAPEGLRAPFWAAAAVFGIVGALFSGAGRRAPSAMGWVIDPGHFSERHALFVIICLGEVLVAAGATAFAGNDALRTGPGLVVAVFVACILWWMYFAYVPRVSEHALARTDERSRGTVARDLFSFGHFPMVFGIIAFAVVVKHVVFDPTRLLHHGDLWILATSLTTTIGGFMAFHFMYNRGVAIERPLALAALLVLVLWGGRHLPGALLLTAVGAVLLVMHAVTMRWMERRLAEGELRMAARAATHEEGVPHAGAAEGQRIV